MKMKKTILLISIITFIGNVCIAQSDSINKKSDTLLVKKTEMVKNDTIITNQSDSDKYALLYVYRPKNFAGFAITYQLKVTSGTVENTPVGPRVKNNSAFVVRLYQEGKTEIFAKTESKKSVFTDVKFGQKYYLKCGITMGILVGRPELNLISPEQGVLDYDNVIRKK